MLVKLNSASVLSHTEMLEKLYQLLFVGLYPRAYYPKLEDVHGTYLIFLPSSNDVIYFPSKNIHVFLFLP